MESYSDSEYSDKRISPVANIRNNFVSDEVLFNVFKDITNDDSITNVYTDKERNCLLNYPEGTLYFFNSKEVEITNSLILALELYIRLNGEAFKLEENRNFLKIIPMLKGFFSNEEGFSDTVMDMFIEYQRKVFSDNNMDFSEYYSIDKEVYRDRWLIQDEADSMRVNTPFTNKSVDLSI